MAALFPLMTSTTSAKETKRRLPVWAVIFWLLVWEIAARWVADPIFLASPLAALKRLSQLVLEAAFWHSVLFSLGHILLGFVLSAVLGIVLAALSYRFRMVRELLSPVTAAVKAVPVASFVILVLLWLPSRQLSIVISVLIGFPVIYSNVLTGLDSTDPKLIEMAKVFRVPFLTQLRAIYLYEVLPFLRTGLSIAIGLCWKSGIAAEVIGVPKGSIGEKLYQSKIYLETADLFCWTLVIVLLSIACEKLLKILLKRIEKGASACWKRLG